MYALSFALNVSRPGSGMGDLPEDDEGEDKGDTEKSTGDAKDNGDMFHSVEIVGDCGAGVVDRSIPASSFSISRSSLNSSSVKGKKLRERALAFHLLAFLNSTQTSIRPGRLSARPRRSRRLEIVKRMQPFDAATPSRALSRPESESVLESLVTSLFLRPLDELSGAMGPIESPSRSLFLSPPGVPVESEILVTLRVKAASRSSRSTVRRVGTRDMRVARVPPEIQGGDRERV